MDDFFFEFVMPIVGTLCMIAVVVFGFLLVHHVWNLEFATPPVTCEQPVQ